MNPATNSGSNDDADLKDLLEAQERVPLTGSEGQPSAKQQLKQHGGNGGICQCISAHLSYLCFAYPSLCGCLACVVSFVVVTLLVANAVNPTLKYGVVPHDWTAIKSSFDLDIGKIDHWCLNGSNDGCRCDDPLVPASRVELRSWTEAFKDNKRQVEKYIGKDLDIALVGESAIEEADGRCK